MTIDAQRYARQIRLPSVGMEGQERLAASSVLVVGAGGLGSPALHLLAASGVGTIGIVDFDHVDLSNLHRQTLYATTDIGKAKVDAARQRILDVNPDVTVQTYEQKLTVENAGALLGPYDVVLDGSDTFATRYAVNEASVATATPNVFASVDQFSGQLSVFGTETGPCYRCLFPEPPPPGLIPNCADGGVLGVVPALFGTLQATEALKWILGIGEPLVGRLLLVDALAMQFDEIRVERDPMCPACGSGTSALPAETPEITVRELQRLQTSGSPPTLVDVRTQEERAERSIGGVHVPLAELEERIDQLWGGEMPLVIYCKSGARSAQAVSRLAERGIRATSLRGGIEAWLSEVEAPSP